MPKFYNTNVTENTSLPVHGNQVQEYTRDQKTNKFFDNFYSANVSVDPNEYELIRGFLKEKKIPESSIDNLAITLAEVAKEQGLSAADIIDLSSTSGDVQLDTIFCILLNTTRNRTSVLGFKKEEDKPTFDVQRTVLP